MILTTVDELKKYIPSTITVDLELLRPFIDNDGAKLQLRKTYLGKALFDSVKDAYEDPDFDEASEFYPLVEKCQSFLANYALLKFLPSGQINIGASGISITVSGESRPPTPKQYDDLITSMIERSDEALEDLLEFLEEDALGAQVYFITWEESKAYTVISNSFLSTAAKFDEQYKINESRSTFLSLLPWMLEAENKNIRNVLTSALYVAMKAKISDNSFSNHENAILPDIKKAIAYLTIYKCIPHLAIKINDQGLQVNILSESLNTKVKKSASEERLTALRNECYNQAEYYLSEIEKYLKANAADFPEYPQDSDAKEDSSFDMESEGGIAGW